MRFRLLGQLEVIGNDGQRVEIPARRRRLLLAILLLQRGRSIQRPELIDALWGDEIPDAAPESLFAHLSRLRRELGRDAVRSVPGGYVLPLDEHDLDVLTFEREVAAGRSALHIGRWQAASAVLGDALARWQGPALAEFASEAFAQPEIARLQQLREDALEDRNDADLALGRHRELVPELEQLVQIHPLRERLWAQLMLALYRSGRQSDALERYRRLHRTLVADLGLDPSPEVQALQGQILRQDPSLTPQNPAGAERVVRLPEPATSFFGRRQEVELAIEVLDSHRELTLTGPGGVGKTRLSLVIAQALVARHPDGTFFVDLSSARDRLQVGDQIADALGGGDPAAVIGQRRMLVVLDNFEQVVDAAPMIAEMLAACPNLRVVVTSRAPLRIDIERRLDIGPLEAAEAAALFIDRVRAVLTAPDLDGALVEEVVERLDRLPLAVELAAAAVVPFSLESIRERLGEPLSVLGAGRRDAPERHRGLRSTIAWSYDLLSPASRAVFRRLSVLAAGFDLDAALAIGEADPDAVDELVAQSLLRRTADRYAMLETVRAFAAEQAAAHDETAAARDRHLAHYAPLPLRALGGRAGREAAARESESWVDACAADLANFRLAFDWATESANVPAILDLYLGIGLFWLFRGLVDVGLRWSDVALRAVDDRPAEEQIGVLIYATEYHRSGGDLQAALGLKERLVSLALGVGDLAEAAVSLDDVGWIHAALDDFPRAWAVLGEARALHDRETACPPDHRLQSLGTIAEVMVREGRAAEAVAVLASLGDAEGEAARSDPGWLANVALIRGQALLGAGDARRARDAFLRVLEIGSSLGYRMFVSNALDGLAELESHSRPEVSALALGLAGQVRHETGSPVWLPDRRLATIRAVRGALGPRAFHRLHADGERLSLAALKSILAERSTPEPKGASG